MNNQPWPCASSLTRLGASASFSLTATTSPETGAKTSLAAFTLSTTAAGVALLELGADLGQLDEDDVAELLLRIIGDADGGESAATSMYS